MPNANQQQSQRSPPQQPQPHGSLHEFVRMPDGTLARPPYPAQRTSAMNANMPTVVALPPSQTQPLLRSGTPPHQYTQAHFQPPPMHRYPAEGQPMYTTVTTTVTPYPPHMMYSGAPGPAYPSGGPYGYPQPSYPSYGYPEHHVYYHSQPPQVTAGPVVQPPSWYGYAQQGAPPPSAMPPPQIPPGVVDRHAPTEDILHAPFGEELGHQHHPHLSKSHIRRAKQQKVKQWSLAPEDTPTAPFHLILQEKEIEFIKFPSHEELPPAPPGSGNFKKCKVSVFFGQLRFDCSLELLTWIIHALSQHRHTEMSREEAVSKLPAKPIYMHRRGTGCAIAYFETEEETETLIAHSGRCLYDFTGIWVFKASEQAEEFREYLQTQRKALQSARLPGDFIVIRH